MKPFQLRIPAHRDHLPVVAEAIHAFGGEAGWSGDLALQIELVCEELLVNIMDYGYPERTPGEIEITLETRSSDIRITVTDDGVAFDPWQQPSPDLDAPLEARQPGGLGLLLVKTIMNVCTYRCINGRNQVVLTKVFQS
jgi:serine/threonine-protein kinase RsbW